MNPLSDLLVSPEEMGRIDRAAIASGIVGYALMRMAGEAVAARVLSRFPEIARAVVLCGPGNNGGDGYVAAAALRRAGVSVAVHVLGDPQGLRGDAALAHAACGLATFPVADYRPQPGDVVVDALFGAGLARPIEGTAAECLGRVGESRSPVVAVDLPSGVSGNSGKVLGTAVQAHETVTFFARKPGHLLQPGRSLCGELTVADIGIPRRLAAIASGNVRENGPACWLSLFPAVVSSAHKYARGHLGVFSGPMSGTGAARLAAAAGAAIGAGLVTVGSPAGALGVNASQLTAVMVREVDDAEAVRTWVADRRMTAFVLGPGFGTGQKAREFALAIAAAKLVLDADGITAFAGRRDALFSAFAGDPTRLVLTPHAGEFGRLFPDIAADGTASKVEAARRAAAMANAVVIFKGSDTVVAAPDGRAVINANAPAWLATAGSGDVLAGMVGGLLAQGMQAFEAAAAAVWIHGEAAHLLGPGMTADDLPSAVGKVHIDGSRARRTERA